MSTDASTVAEYFRAHQLRSVLDAFVAEYTQRLHAQREHLTQAQRYAAPTAQSVPGDKSASAAAEGDDAAENTSQDATAAPVESPVTALHAFLCRHRAATAAAATARPYALILVEGDDDDAKSASAGEAAPTPHGAPAAMQAALQLAERLAGQTSGRVLVPPPPPSATAAPDSTDETAAQAKRTTDMLNGGAAAVGPSWIYEQDDVQTRRVRRRRQFIVSSLQERVRSAPASGAPTLFVGRLTDFPRSVGDVLAMEEVLGAPRAVLVLQKDASAGAGSGASDGDADAEARQRRRLASGANALGWMQDLTRPQQLLVLSRECAVQEKLLSAGAGTATAGQDAESRRETDSALRCLGDARQQAVLEHFESERCLQCVPASEWRDAEYMEALVGGFVAALRQPLASA